jgi:hypothetical protein
MKNIVSFSLWGDNPKYWVGALENIKLVKEFYPGFIPRFYIDRNSKQELIESIREKAEVILVDSKGSFHGMFWRFFASEDEDVDIFLSRDCDSRISKREVEAVGEWLSSDKDLHIMRDHPYHTVPILGGMWGSRRGLMRGIGISKLINEWGNYERGGVDQDFLATRIYPLVYKTAFEHSEFNIRFNNDIRPFPTDRENFEFVGDVFDENNLRHPQYWRLIE